ncbi:MAG TPA: NAD(P)/FAD-dependent oxidoreductase [Spirochaetia bacterium]
MSSSEGYDVIVVGAGCAGPAAARKAAMLGLRTVLIEKARVPGEKNVSGTCLNTAALSDPDLHYLLDGPVEREIRSMRTYQITKGRTTIIEERPDTGILLLSIRRDRFDAWHAEQARRAGVEVRLGTAVTDVIREDGAFRGVRTDAGDVLKAKVVIDAGGCNSIVGRRAGLISRRSGTAMILYVTVAIHLGKKKIDERFGDTIEYYLAPGCQHKVWPWVFPKRDVITLGTGGYMTPELITDACPSVNTYMQSFMDLPVLRPRLSGGKIASWGLHLEYDEATPQRTADGLILAGEAGGFVMPFLGEGMPESFFTGIYAAQAAAKGIAAGDVRAGALLSAYEEMLDANLFMKAFGYVAAANKASILSRTDDQIASMMQTVVMGGGFITNAAHTGWMSGADEGDIEKVRQARDFLELLQPYRDIGSDFDAIYAARKRK